jgi:uncharacterized protein (TIGR02646 family)
VIRVDRARKDKNKTIQPDKAWLTKAQKQTKKAVSEGAAHQVSDLYRDVQVKMALEKLFYGKCAYCETRLGVAGDWDVEHYRPKGRVSENPAHPGYYWLAYTWENLLPSCTYCNQNRKDAPLYDEPEPGDAAGKLDQFPLVDENRRAMTPADDLRLEQPLLINPCDPADDPEQQLTYDIHGQIFALDEQNRRANETIRICHLKRRRLRDDRLQIIIQTSKTLKALSLAQSQHQAQIVALLTDTLNSLTAPGAEYAGAARAVVYDPDAFIACC